MRCLAAEVAYSQKERRLMTEYGMWMLEWCDTVVGVALIREYGFGLTRLQRFFDESRGGITEMVERYTPEYMAENGKRGWHKADASARLTDGINTMLSVIERELRTLGFADWRLESIEAADKFDEQRHYRNRQAMELTHAARKAWYEINGRRAIRIYFGAILLYMHDEHGYGAKRLGKLYAETAPLIREYIERFLLSDIRADKEMQCELAAMHEILTDKGIELVEMPGEDTVTVRQGTEAEDTAVSATAQETIAQYDKIMREVQKSNHRRILK